MRFLLCILILSSFVILSKNADARSAVNMQPLGCPVELEIIAVFKTPVLGQGFTDQRGVNFKLKPTIAINDSEACQRYQNIDHLEMNSVDEILSEIDHLKPGDLLRGYLTYHAPSPHGKTLMEEYHHGFHITDWERSSALPFTTKRMHYDAPLYYRHIGVFRD